MAFQVDVGGAAGVIGTPQASLLRSLKVESWRCRLRVHVGVPVDELDDVPATQRLDPFQYFGRESLCMFFQDV